jgi:tripartite-type tricarboxylate transporter receptor subunit TctC
MTVARRISLTIAAALIWMAAEAGAQTPATNYPNKPVRWIVPFPTGASNDIVARTIAQKLNESLGQQFLVDNRAGAGGLIGAEIVAKAEPDGYTLLLANAGPSLNNVLMRKNPTYGIKDFASVVWFGYAPLIIVTASSFPLKNAKDLVAYAKENPGKLTWASSGIGGTLHIGLAQFQAATSIRVTHVPYKGAAPALVDVIGGQVNVMHTSTLSIEPYIKLGRIQVLAVAGPKRQTVIPNVSTLAEQGIVGGDSIAWYGMSVPAKTPRAIIEKLNREVNRVLQLPDVRNRFAQLGLEVEGGTAEKFDALINAEQKALSALIRAGAVQVE